MNHRWFLRPSLAGLRAFVSCTASNSCQASAWVGLWLLIVVVYSLCGETVKESAQRMYYGLPETGSGRRQFSRCYVTTYHATPRSIRGQLFISIFIFFTFIYHKYPLGEASTVSRWSVSGSARHEERRVEIVLPDEDTPTLVSVVRVVGVDRRGPPVGHPQFECPFAGTLFPVGPPWNARRAVTTGVPSGRARDSTLSSLTQIIYTWPQSNLV